MSASARGIVVMTEDKLLSQARQGLDHLTNTEILEDNLSENYGFTSPKKLVQREVQRFTATQ